MRELEMRIEQWRREMRAKLGREAAEELESHLRDAIDGFVSLGRGEAEAFELAVKRLGSADHVSAEFHKSDGSWWAIKAATASALFILFGSAALAAAIALKGGPIKWLLAAHVFAASTGYLGALLVGGIGICYLSQRLWREFSPTADATAARALIALASGAVGLIAVAIGLGMIWAKLEWGRF